MKSKNPTDVTVDLEKFEEYWKEIGKKFERSELTEKESQYWKNRFKRARSLQDGSLFITHCSNSLENYPSMEVYNKLEEIENNFFSSIGIAKANYRKKEREISKEKWGVLGRLINILIDIKRKLI